MVILPASIIGGLGLTVLMELFDAFRGARRLSGHARTVLTATAVIYLVGMLTLLAVQFPDRPTTTTAAIQQSRTLLPSAAATALNTRTLGWPIESPAAWPRTVIWIVLILMPIGASPAGTGGGLKTTTLVALARGARAALGGRPVARVLGIAMVWCGAYLVVVLITGLRLLTTEPQLPADQILFIATSAVGNVGISNAPISITGNGLYALSIGMMLGRILPLVILWWTALGARDTDLAVG
jgi:trk system potassium uptake protein TrkH